MHIVHQAYSHGESLLLKRGIPLTPVSLGWSNAGVFQNKHAALQGSKYKADHCL